jgi:polyhydroxybutyrate depolymerase
MKKNTSADIGRVMIVLFILSVFSAGCATTLPRDHIVGQKTYKNTVDLRINGFRRTYLVHVPPGYPSETPLPLVVVIHGAFDTADDMERKSGFSQIADREGFIVLYPNGMGILGFLQHWNAGHCCGKAADEQLDDVGFVATTIEDVCTRLKVDRDRIYMVGFSNGGMLAYRFAAERGNLLAAVAPVAASIGGSPSKKVPEWRIPEPVGRIPVIAFHGLSDDSVPFTGGVSPRKGGPRTYWSVEESVKFWVVRNGCNPQAAGTESNIGRVLLRSWNDCKNEAEVALYLIRDWGHDWPGKSFTSTLSEDDPLKNFDAAEIIWDFFKSHQRTPALPEHDTKALGPREVTRTQRECGVAMRSSCLSPDIRSKEKGGTNFSQPLDFIGRGARI